MNAIIFFITIFFTAVMGFPHVGMLDTPTVRDVGLIFDERDYNGTSTFLIETEEPTCFPFNVNSQGQPQGLQIASVQICKPTTCAFFTGENCEGDSDDTLTVSCEGPGDVADHESDKLYKSYICGSDVAKWAEGSTKLDTVPHNPNAVMV